MKKYKILALDCSLRFTCAALSDGDKIIKSEAQDLGRRQAAELPVITERILRDANLNWQGIDFIALTNGPGYFTGIRVGAAYAAGLAYALGVKIIPVSSLEALAENIFNKNLNLLVIVYAGRGSVYAVSYGDNKLILGRYDAEAVKNFIDKNKNLKIISDDPERALEALNLNNIKCECVTPSAEGLIKAALKKIDIALSPAELKIEYCKGAV